MFIRKLFVTLSVLACLTAATFAQSYGDQRIAVVPLTLDKGFPLDVVLGEKLPSKLNQPVHGKIVEPVYALDREIIPAGTEVLGKVTALRSPGKWKRISSMLGGDFTPLHTPEITFDTLVFADGKRTPIETSVTPQGSLVFRFKKGQTRAYTAAGQQTGKDLIHSMLWSLSPYRPQFVPAGTTYKATLLQPLEFGSAYFGAKALNNMGSEPPAGSIIYARLTSAIDSKTTKSGTPVQSILTYPLYSFDNRLLFPAGSILHGQVGAVRPAGFWHRGGSLEVKFTRIEPPIEIKSSMSQVREIHGRMVGVGVNLDLNGLRIDKDGMTQVARTNERFLAPAFALVGAAPMLSAGATNFGTAFGEAYGTSLFSRMFGGTAGLGLPAGVAGMMVPPVGIGLGAYDLGYAVYVNILGHGKNISLPADTAIEVRIDN